MGKTVLVIDLNPLSRTAKMASVTVVDELTRVVRNMNGIFESEESLTLPTSFHNQEIVQQALDHICTFFAR